MEGCQSDVKDSPAGDGLLITDMRCALPASGWTDADCTVHHRPVAKMPPGKWRVIDYRSTLYSGSMLQTTHPDACVLRIPLGRVGWHAVSIGIAHPWGHDRFVEVRLSGDDQWQVIEGYRRTPSGDPTSGGPLHEEPWTFADLTGRDLEVRYPVDYPRSSKGGACTIYSVRAVPVREEDIPLLESRRHYRLVAFADQDFSYDPRFLNDEWDVVCCNNVEADVVFYRSTVGVPLGEGAWDTALWGSWAVQLNRQLHERLERGEDPLQEAIERAHRHGKRFWMGIRPQAWASGPPLDQAIRSPFFCEHPEYRCVEADGAALSKLSIAFGPVRQRLNAILQEALDRGADGVTVIFVRGFPLVRYEGPVRERYQALYSAEVREVPDSDERLLRVWAEFVTQWMRELRDMLDAAGPTPLTERRELTAITGPSLEWNLQFGIDVADWAREGLIDVVMPYPWGGHHTARLYSKPYEKPDGWIDVAEYRNALNGTPVQLIPSLGHYADHYMPLAAVRQRALAFYQAGATGLCRWDNTNDVSLARISLDDPRVLELWCSRYMPPQDNTITEIEGLNVERFPPGTAY